MIKNMGMEFIHILMVDPTKVSGHMVNSTVKVYLLHLKELKKKGIWNEGKRVRWVDEDDADIKK